MSYFLLSIICWCRDSGIFPGNFLRHDHLNQASWRNVNGRSEEEVEEEDENP